MSKTWSVLVAYENDLARKAAMRFCDRLAERFWTRCNFEVTWLPFDVVEDCSAPEHRAARPLEADMLVVAANPAGEFPESIRAWTESWVANRGDREGALIGLLGSEGNTIACADKHVYLRDAACRAGMDYFTDVPENLFEPIPDSIEDYNERAMAMTPVLEEILRCRRQPPVAPV
jgi:hypothetical protein